MAALSQSVALEFCKLCGWAYEAWLNHRELFDLNPRTAELQKSFAGDELARLSVISQEYSLLQIAKLHDPAVVSRKVTLGIDYVVTYGAWSPGTRTQLESLRTKLNEFGAQLRDVRNKSLSHNDLAQIVAGATLGEFQSGEDELYFQSLQEFVDIVHGEVLGGPWPFNDLVKNDVAAFMAVLRP
jgi:AbiU2